jgi:ParB family chromosome partitioning protein
MANHKSRLGRGLGALINNAAGEQPPKGAKKTAVSSAQPIAEVIVADASAAAGVYQALQLDSIQSNPYQPRRDFDESAIADLAKSIEAEGLLQPIVVRAKGDQYELIAGERRFRAVQHLGQATIVARVMEVSDASSASLALIENLQREDLNPIDEALGFASLLRDFDLTQEAAAARVGKGRATVANAMRLLTLEPEVQDLLRQRLISSGHAKVLLGLSSRVEQKRLAQAIVEQGLSVRAAEECVRQAKQGLLDTQQKDSSASRLAPVEQSVIKELEKRLGAHLDTRVVLKHGQKKGRLTIEYAGNQDLERILDKLQLPVV